MGCRYITLKDQEIKSQLWSDIRSTVNSDELADIHYSTAFSKEFIKHHGDWIIKGKEPSIHEFNTTTSDGPQLRTPDAQLTDDGKKEADSIGDKLSKEQIPMTYVSPYPRTLQTADRILQKQPITAFESNQGLTQSHINPTSDINNQSKLTSKQKNNELQSIFTGRLQQSSRSGTFQHALSIIRGLEEAGQGRKIGNSEVIWRAIRSAGFEYTGAFGEKWSNGNESNVYRKPGSQDVIKERFRLTREKPLTEFLQETLVHNYLFPQTDYKLLGFKHSGDSILPIIEQREIEKNGEFNPDIVSKVLAAKGFTSNGGFIYRNREMGITIGDIVPKNVFLYNNIPYFIDPRIDIDHSFWSTPIPKTQPDIHLDKKVEQFLKSIGVNTQHIADIGQDFAGMADTINGIIKVVDGKAGIETLGHEASHMFMNLLPDNSKLLVDIMRDVKLRDEYDEVYDLYKDDPAYHNVDGSVNEDKIAKETASHIIDDIIVDKFQDTKALKWWERLWNYIKNLFRGKSLDSFHQVAEDILNDNTSKLSKDKIGKMKAANARGEIYYEKDPSFVRHIEELKKGATDIQKTIIDNFLLDPSVASPKKAEVLGLSPASEKVLESTEHIYSNPITGQVSESVTRQISGEFDETKKVLYKPNADAGDTYDKIFQNVINGETPDKIMKSEFPMKFALQDRMRDFVTDCGNVVRDFQEDGSIVVPQMITSNDQINIAGSKDLSVFHPDGSETIVDLKTSIRSVYNKNGKVDKELSKTYTSKWLQNEGSIFNNLTEKNDKGTITAQPRIAGEKPVKLSKEQQHSIQVGSYAKMDELQGIPVRATQTWHIQVDLQQQDDGTFVIKDYRNEGLRDIPLGSNKQYIDKVIPVEQEELSQLQKDYLETKPDTISDPEYKPTPEELKAVNESLNTSLDKIKQEFSKREASALDFTRKSSLEEIKNLVSDIQNLQDKGEVQQAMAKALNYIGTITRENLKFISKDENFKHPKYYIALKEALLIAASDNELLPARLRKDLTSTQKEIFDGIKENMSELEEMSGIQAKNYVLRRTANKSIDDDTPIDMAVLEDIYFPKSRRDISLTGSWATDFTGLDNNIIQQAVHTAQVVEKTANIENEGTIKRIADKGNSFMDIPGAKEALKDDNFWHRIYKLKTVTENGKAHQEPYSYINPIGQQYYDLADSHQSALIDENGEYKKPIIIRDIKDGTREQLDYNIELASAREANRKFNEPETLDKNGEITNGEYHHLSDEYRHNRIQVLEPHIIKNGDGDAVFVDWRLRGDLTEDSPEVKKFRNRYQTKIRYEKFVKKAGNYTGVVTEEEGWFPNKENIEINRKTTTSQESMENPRYVSLREDHSPLGRGVWDAYKFLMDEYVEGANEAGGEANRYIRNRGIVGLQAHFFQKAAKTGTLNTLKYNYAEFFTAVHKSNIEKTSPDGVTRMQLRIPHIGSLRSREKIAEIEQQITDLSTKKTTMGKSVYNKELKELNRQLEMESHKLSPTNLELDPFKQMIMWRTGIHTFVAKQNIEGEMLAYDWALRQQKFEKKTGRQVAKTDINGNPVFKSFAETDSFRAMNQLLKNFYGITTEETNLGVLATRFRNLNTLGVMGLNIMNGINNTFLYQLNWASHGLSGRYELTAKNYARANKILTKEYMPGVVQRRLDKAVKYGSKRAYSKPESLFRTLSVAVDQKATEGAPNWATKSYIFEGMAIKTAQMGLFIQGMLDYSIQNHETGETVPVWDAFTYNPNTGESNLKTGFILGDAIEVAVKIGDVQTEIQGNFQQINQPAMRSTLLGALMTQFKQFFATSFNNRFRRRFTHSTLGEQEGSWRSVVSLGQILMDFDGKWQDAFNPFDSEKRKEFWSEVPDDIKHNLVFDGIDILKLMVLFGIGAIIRGIAQDVPDSDPTQKRWMNFLAYTASRLRFEQQMWNPVLGIVQMNEFVQNPIAMSNTLRTFAEAMYLSAEFPFQTDDERYYKTGVFKGQSKATHQIMRFLPLAKMQQRWIGLKEIQSAEGSVLGAQGH